MPDAYTKAEADNRFARTTTCYWKWVSGGADAGLSVDAACESGFYAMAGGCDINGGGGSIVESHPAPSSGNYKGNISPWPVGANPSDPINPVIDQWHCRVTPGGIIDVAFVMCCPPR